MGRKKDWSDHALQVGMALDSPERGNDTGGYEISTAFVAPARRKLLGLWVIQEHLIAGISYLDHFIRQQLRGSELGEASYSASYEFKEAICIKKVAIEGLLAAEGGNLHYEYRTAVVLSWRPGPGKVIIVQPEIGYMLSSLDGNPAACKDLPGSGEELRISYRFEGKDLVLEEGNDHRLLRRM
ncbi:MAG: hypothetical protein ACOYM2_17950 [Rectinemataceae bacterium]